MEEDAALLRDGVVLDKSGTSLMSLLLQVNAAQISE